MKQTYKMITYLKNHIFSLYILFVMIIVWHFYLGDRMTVVELDPTVEPQQYRLISLGPDVMAGDKVQHTVKAGTWFGSYANEGSHAFSFVGCTVSPGFDFTDFQLASRASLLAEFPGAKHVVEKLTEGLP